MKNVTARWIHQSFEKPYDLRTFRAFRLRSVPLCRSTNAVLIVRLTPERANADCRPAAVPKINRVATSTTRKRVWTTGGEEAHHLIDPRTGAPSAGDLAYATVAAPSILEADLAAKLLIIEGRAALARLDGRFEAIVTDREGKTEVLTI